MGKRIAENVKSICEMKVILERLEEMILNYELQESLVNELAEISYWANELLQSRICYDDIQALETIIRRVRHLQLLYLETSLDFRADQLTKELKGLLSEEAWRVFLRLDEVRGMELEYFHGKDFHRDYNIALLINEQELQARLSAIKLKTY